MIMINSPDTTAPASAAVERELPVGPIPGVVTDEESVMDCDVSSILVTTGVVDKETD